jgi:pyruvate formate-lyase activating enzyme-like uncharacterized protein
MTLLQQLQSNTQQIPHEITQTREETVNTLKELIKALDEIRIHEDRCTEYNPSKSLWYDIAG